MKKFEANIEVITSYEVVVYADDFEDAIARAHNLPLSDVEEGTVNDAERHVIGVSRVKESRLYR